MRSLSVPQALDLALQHHVAGRLPEAEALYRQILAAEPAHAPARHFLGVIAHQCGQHEAAVDLIRQAIARRSDNAEYFNNLGAALSSLSRFEEAVAAFRQAIALEPNYADAWYNLGNGLRQQSLSDEALAAYRRTIELRPEQAEAHCNLASELTIRGQLEEAVTLYRQAVTLRPETAAIRSDLIFALHYLPDLAAGTLNDEHHEWNRRHAEPVRTFLPPCPHDRSPERRLRVGFVSADLRDHVVGRTLLPVFEALDRTRFELICYSATAPTEPCGERFAQLADAWRPAASSSDDVLAQQIREDRIDLLVDLSLHTAHNRLPVFARRPAPVQMSWLGYPGTSGVEGIDYYLSDPFLDPPGARPSALPGEAIRLPECWCSYGAPSLSPEPGELPALRQGCVTFASFNNFAKINHRVLELWATILHRVKGSRLRLLAKAGRLEDAIRFFEHLGIAPERIEVTRFLPEPISNRETPRAPAYLARLQEVDLALDPFPYNGMTTTCDALWMGVPVVALIGDRPISRASFSLLSNVGLPELAAHSPLEYADLAVSLAHDLPRLATLRADLRRRMRTSPLLDAPRLARHVEAGWRTAWRRWCLGASST